MAQNFFQDCKITQRRFGSAQVEQSSLSAWRRFGSLATHRVPCKDSDLSVRCKYLYSYRKLSAPAHIKGSIFHKNRHFIIQERFNKLIYVINTRDIYVIHKMWHLTACKISVGLSFLNWIKNDMTFYRVPESLLDYGLGTMTTTT